MYCTAVNQASSSLHERSLKLRLQSLQYYIPGMVAPPAGEVKKEAGFENPKELLVSINQSINQSIDQSTNKSINIPIN